MSENPKVQEPHRSVHWEPVRPQYSLKVPLLILVTIACQAPDFQFEGVKLGELLALMAVPFALLYYREIPKVFGRLFFSMVLVSIITLVGNRFRVFYEPELGVSALRRVDVITICRLISFGCCLVTAALFYRSCKAWEGFAQSFLKLQSRISLMLLGCWGLSFAGLYLFVDTEGHRLHGFYNEGGPLGTLNALLFNIATIMGLSLWVRIPFALCVFAAGSKAGILYLVLAPAIVLAPKLSRTAVIALTAIVVAATPFAFRKIAGNYIQSIENVESLLLDHAEDTNFAMGRVAGIQILPEMVRHNPIFGVGLGNYSLVRNDPRYRGIFPEVDLWDLSGLGGIATLMAESGIVGILLCLIPLIGFFRENSGQGRSLFVSSMLAFVFGIQFYFPFPWVGVAFACLPSWAKGSSVRPFLFPEQSQ